MTGKIDPADSAGPSDSKDPQRSASDSAALLGQLAEHSPHTSRYTLKGEVGRGGMGAILRVWDADLRRHLAMKVVNLVRGQVKSFDGRVSGGSAASFHKRAAEHVPVSLREVCAPVLAVLEQIADQIQVFDRRIEHVSDERHPQTAVLRHGPSRRGDNCLPIGSGRAASASCPVG